MTRRCAPSSPLLPAGPASLTLATDGGNRTALRLIGRVEVPGPVGASLDVWSLRQYAGGLFVPVRDGTAGETSYGGGRYLLDTAKGADLGVGSGYHAGDRPQLPLPPVLSLQRGLAVPAGPARQHRPGPDPRCIERLL